MAEVLSTQGRGTVFPFTDGPKPVNNVYDFSVFFLLKMNENLFANFKLRALSLVINVLDKKDSLIQI